jgi:hypothetical protein
LKAQWVKKNFTEPKEKNKGKGKTKQRKGRHHTTVIG